MQPTTRWRPQPTMGKEKEKPQRPTFLPLALRTEWDLATTTRHNLLLVGSSSATDALLDALKPHLREPLRHCSPRTGLPAPEGTEGTLVLSEVAGLDINQQVELYRWLDRFEQQVRVVSTTSEPLFPLVQAGAFLADLYYRLNIVLFDLTSSSKSML